MKISNSAFITSYERDNEVSLDFAQNRYYNPKHERFTTVDEPFADQFEDNPQSWNLYSYVRDNPLNLVDPSGLSACDPEKDQNCRKDEDGEVITINTVIDCGGDGDCSNDKTSQVESNLMGRGRRAWNQFDRAMPNLGSWLRHWFGSRRNSNPSTPSTPSSQPRGGNQTSQSNQPNQVYGPPSPLPVPPYLSSRLSAQKQKRHVYPAPGNDSYFANMQDAQTVFNAIRSGNATFLGMSGQNYVYRVNGVTGYINNPGAGYRNQPTNVFMLKDDISPSLAPTNPNWTPT